jgi:hydrogenase maturation factor HypF (carbamoyltransferase family)
MIFFSFSLGCRNFFLKSSNTGLTEEKRQCMKCLKHFNQEKNFRYHSKGCAANNCSECDQVFSHSSLLKKRMDKILAKNIQKP